MIPVTEKQIHACFVNASRRETAQATLPDLAALSWDRLDHLGRRGDTIATLICTEFVCSRNVRRPPTSVEAGTDLEGRRP